MSELFPIYRNVGKIKTVGPLKVPGAMFCIKEGKEVVLIDPFLLPNSEIGELETLGTPTHIFISGAFHVRDAEAYRKRYGCKILINHEAATEVDIKVDDTFGDGETVPGGLTTIGMPGTMLGETIFRRDEGKGTLIIGDAFWNLQLNECGLILGTFMRFSGFPEGFGTMPRTSMTNERLAVESYQKLMNYDFEQILFSHGKPIQSTAKEKMRTVLETLAIL